MVNDKDISKNNLRKETDIGISLTVPARKMAVKKEMTKGQKEDSTMREEHAEEQYVEQAG